MRNEAMESPRLNPASDPHVGYSGKLSTRASSLSSNTCDPSSLQEREVLTALKDSGRTHELKCWPEFFKEVAAGRKPFEIRENDRAFHVGDVLWLREFDPGCDNCEVTHPWTGGYTGRELRVSVTYVTAWQQKPGYVVMGLAAIAKAESAPSVGQQESEKNKTRECELDGCKLQQVTKQLNAICACGQPIDIREIYRCADCATPFHRHCIKRHFRDHVVSATAIEQRAANWLVSDLARFSTDAYIVNLVRDLLAACQGVRRDCLRDQQITSSVAAAPAWRAMEDAPKDGTRVICWGPQLAVAECEYRQEWHGQPEGWYRSNQHPRVEPTHWQPLPPPPLPRSPRAGEDQQP